MAVADQSGIVQFPRYSPGNEAYGSLAARVWPGASILGYDAIPAITLDEYIASSKIDHVNHLKVDTEEGRVFGVSWCQ